MGSYYSGVMNSDYDSELKHWGILGQKWGIRRFQNEDGTLTPAGKERYAKIAERRLVSDRIWSDVLNNTILRTKEGKRHNRKTHERLDNFKNASDDVKAEVGKIVDESRKDYSKEFATHSVLSLFLPRTTVSVLRLPHLVDRMDRDEVCYKAIDQLLFSDKKADSSKIPKSGTFYGLDQKLAAKYGIKRSRKSAVNRQKLFNGHTKFEKQQERKGMYGYGSEAEEELKSKGYHTEIFDDIAKRAAEKLQLEDYYKAEETAARKRNANLNPFSAKKLNVEYEKARKEVIKINDNYTTLTIDAIEKVISKMPKDDQPAAYAYLYSLLGFDW